MVNIAQALLRRKCDPRVDKREAALAMSPTRVLVVDDHDPWRRLVCSMLQKHPELQVVGEAADGFEAVQKARVLQPDLILLDISLPTINGIKAARQIRELSTGSKILFVSENRSWDVAQEALRTGGDGYVVKSRAASELLPAIKAALQGSRFVGSGCNFASSAGSEPIDGHGRIPAKDNGMRHHEAHFYSDNPLFLNSLAQFIGGALRAGGAAIVVATAPNREGLLPILLAQGLDMDAVIQQGRYIAPDAADANSSFVCNGIFDANLVVKVLGGLIVTAAHAAKKEARLAVFGECVSLLCEQGDAEAAIQMEKAGNQLVQMYDIDILCGYSLGRFQGGVGSPVFQQVCAEHTAVYLG